VIFFGKKQDIFLVIFRYFSQQPLRSINSLRARRRNAYLIDMQITAWVWADRDRLSKLASCDGTICHSLSLPLLHLLSAIALRPVSSGTATSYVQLPSSAHAVRLGHFHRSYLLTYLFCNCSCFVLGMQYMHNLTSVLLAANAAISVMLNPESKCLMLFNVGVLQPKTTLEKSKRSQAPPFHTTILKRCANEAFNVVRSLVTKALVGLFWCPGAIGQRQQRLISYWAL